MARPKTLKGSKLLLLLGNGADPEVFAAPCGLNARGINFSKETSDSTVPDCDDPEKPSWQERSVVSLSGTISGSGILALEALPTWREFFFSTDPKTVRVKLDAPLADNGGYWEGLFHCTSFNINGPNGEKIGVEIELQNDGEVLWVDASA